MPTPKSVLLECLEATERLAGGEEGWVTARAVARRLSPTADVEEIGRDLTRLERVGLVEVSFEGGSSYYRRSR
jgi:DNA-binding transcriptional ArsR family regulator